MLNSLGNSKISNIGFRKTKPMRTKGAWNKVSETEIQRMSAGASGAKKGSRLNKIWK
jgi:hypothetical protein